MKRNKSAQQFENFLKKHEDFLTNMTPEEEDECLRENFSTEELNAPPTNNPPNEADDVPF